MGDRGNIVMHYEVGGEIYFYSHWRGSDLPKILQAALLKGKDRWDDSQYLPRIVFCELVKGDEGGRTGYGISPTIGDNEYALLHVHLGNQTIKLRDHSWTFGEFCTLKVLPSMSPRERVA